MSKTYRIHFGYSPNSKRYKQAIEIAKLAYNYTVKGQGLDVWHIATFTEEQLNLMANLWELAYDLPSPKVYGANIRSLYKYCISGKEINYIYASKSSKDRVYSAVDKYQKETGKSKEEFAQYLLQEYLNPIQDDWDEVTNRIGQADIKLDEPVDAYKQIKHFISTCNYADAIKVYYSYLGDKYYGELTRELIYLKRLAEVPLTGRDLLYFRTESSRDELISSNLAEYIDCIDEALAQLQTMGRKSPLAMLLEYTPTMDQMIARWEHYLHMGVYLRDGELKRDSSPVKLEHFSSTSEACPKGRLFEKYPDPILHSRVYENTEHTPYEMPWTTYTPLFYRTEILDKQLHLHYIDAYRHKLWKKVKMEPDFTTVSHMSEIEKSNYGAYGIRYTGRIHKINGGEFYEIVLVRKDVGGGMCLGNPFMELVEEIHIEAENLLRARHHLPKIGEGWISEMELFNLVKAIFIDAEHHATPKWLGRQHLDIFIPSKALAFEYQGQQHFQAIDFFGGQESFERRSELDRLKAKKCKVNEVILIQWLHTEPINQTTLMAKLMQAGVSIP